MKGKAMAVSREANGAQPQVVVIRHTLGINVTETGHVVAVVPEEGVEGQVARYRQANAYRVVSVRAV